MNKIISSISRFTALTALAAMAVLLPASCSEDPTPTPAQTATPTATPMPTMSERETLVALYEAMNGADWDENGNWLSNAPLGEWHGVTTDESGRVIELNLALNQLSGEIPPEVGGLPNLASLSLGRQSVEW